MLQVLPEDLDLDGHQDRIRVEVGIVNLERVTDVNVLLEFEYKLEVCCLLDQLLAALSRQP